MTVKFFWNGIKGNDGKLIRGHYSDGPYIAGSLPVGTITFYRKDYGNLPADVCEALKGSIENDTDIITDYFETDTIRIVPTHPLFAQAHEALLKHKARREAGVARWNTKHGIAA